MLSDDQECATELQVKVNQASYLRQGYLWPFLHFDMSIEKANRLESLISQSIGNILVESGWTVYFACYMDVHPVISADDQVAGIVGALCDLGLQKEVETTLAQHFIAEATQHFLREYKEVWDHSVIEESDSWLKILWEKMELLTGRPLDLSDNIQDLSRNLIVDLRTSELFDIVLAYPDSTAALNDLRIAMTRPSQRAKVVSIFQKACSANLLRGGVNTVDIVSGYISTMRSFAILDPRGVLLDRVARPIRRYLRDREDTVSALISGLLGDDSSAISELAELLKSPAVGTGPTQDDCMDLDWKPDPPDAPADFMRESLADTVGSLLSIYDNKEVFVRELMAVFANRLLGQNVTLEQVQQSYELLKARFEDRELQSVDVMIRDMDNSASLNKNIGSVDPSLEDVQASIVSRLFWPSFKEEFLKLPSNVDTQLSNYHSQFSKLQRGRHLTWIKNLGVVTLQLDFADRSVEYQVTPAQATVILLFEKGDLSAADIEKSTDLSETSVRAILNFWVGKGALQQKPDGHYTTVEKESDGATNFISDDVGGSAVQSAEERAAEEMKVYWQYIVGMLTNLGPKPVEQVHSFLKMLVPKETPYTKSQEELEQYLTYLVEDQKLEFVGGSYKLL